MYDGWYIDGDFVVCPQCHNYVAIFASKTDLYRVTDILATIDEHFREGHNQ